MVTCVAWIQTIAADRNNFKQTFQVAFWGPIRPNFEYDHVAFWEVKLSEVKLSGEKVNNYVDDPLTRVTIFPAFISSSGPTVQIISDIRKSHAFWCIISRKNIPY